MYVMPNFKTKKELKQAVLDRRVVRVFQPGLGTVPLTGTVDLEGPHYPAPHTWYAVGEVRDGKLVSVK